MCSANKASIVRCATSGPYWWFLELYHRIYKAQTRRQRPSLNRNHKHSHRLSHNHSLSLNRSLNPCHSRRSLNPCHNRSLNPSHSRSLSPNHNRSLRLSRHHSLRLNHRLTHKQSQIGDTGNSMKEVVAEEPKESAEHVPKMET